MINRAFYGIRPLTNKDGLNTNAVYGFLTIYLNLLEDEKPDGVCVAFDLRAPTFRHLKYDGYKAQRKGMPDELAEQMPYLKKVLDAMSANPTVTIKELQELTGLSESGVKKIIRHLRTAGTIERIGGNKGGRWEVRGVSSE